MFAIVEIGGVPEATTMSDYFLGTSAFGAKRTSELMTRSSKGQHRTCSAASSAVSRPEDLIPLRSAGRRSPCMRHRPLGIAGD